MAYLDKKFTKSNHTIDKSSLSLSSMQQRQLEALTSVCQSHPSEVYTNYCSNSKCLMPLCPDCIEIHLEEHKRSQLFPEIESVKNSRVKCIRKIQKLSEMFQSHLGAMDGPKSIEKICSETMAKLAQIKSFMLQSIDGYFNSLEESIKVRVSDSSTVLREMDTIHNRLKLILEELANLDERLHTNAPTTIPTIRKVFSLDGNGLNDSFMSELNNYNSIRRKAHIDIHFDENKFRQGLSESVSFDRLAPTTNPMLEKTNRTLVTDFSGININNTPIQQLDTPKGEPIQIRESSRNNTKPIIHFFQSESKNLHLIYLPSLQRQIITLHSQYTIPQFHKSLLVSSNEIIITGGLLDEDTKNTSVGKYDIDTKTFNDSFASVVERSSHSLCEVDGIVYIIGGFGREGTERVVERINIRTGAVEKQPPSKFGGPNVTVAVSNRDIVKLSEEGAEIYQTVRRVWSQVTISGYIYYESCAAVDINDTQIFVFGGYTKDQPGGDKGVTDSYILDISDRGNFLIRSLNRHKLPVAEGFWNNTPVIHRKEVYALQNIESEDTDDCVQNERRLLKFDGVRWNELHINQ